MSEPYPSPDPAVAEKLRTRLSPSAIGFLVGSAVPVLFIIEELLRVAIHNAAHPLGPNEARCGTGMAIEAMIAFCSIPFTGIIGWLAARDLSDTA